MSAPMACDWECAQNLGRYLQTYPDLVRVTALDPAAFEGPLVLDMFSDSDWGGFAEMCRNTDSRGVVSGGAVITATTQTQPGRPATSSPNAELRGISAATPCSFMSYAGETLDLMSRCHAYGAIAPRATRRIGPGSKLRYLEVCEFYLQGAVQGTENPGNFRFGKEVCTCHLLTW